MHKKNIANEIRRYLETGEHDPCFSAWTGTSILDRLQNGAAALADALVAEVLSRQEAVGARDFPKPVLTKNFARQKAEPMVRGLFPRAEHEKVLALIDESVVFVGPENWEAVLRAQHYPGSAWTVASLYLLSIGAEALSPAAPKLVGLSEGTTCFVSLEYFTDKDAFNDFVIHEIAHIFHNCKRRTAGLPETRRREWLLDIAYNKRETFAYACEAYSCICKRARPLKERISMGRLFPGFQVNEGRFDSDEVIDIVRSACEVRNGWKYILARCASNC